jgi:hypothetical protein
MILSESPYPYMPFLWTTVNSGGKSSRPRETLFLNSIGAFEAFLSVNVFRVLMVDDVEIFNVRILDCVESNESLSCEGSLVSVLKINEFFELDVSIGKSFFINVRHCKRVFRIFTSL